MTLVSKVEVIKNTKVASVDIRVTTATLVRKVEVIKNTLVASIERLV